MELSAEDRVNMSLDDLIQAQKKSGSSGEAKGNRRQRKPRQRNAAGANPDKNMAKVIGTSKAKRNASINQRRGLNTTGKASKADIQKAVMNQKTQLSQNRRRSNGALPISKGISNGATKGRPNPATGLKISFDPTQLGQTTEKTVSQQIKAVLMKQNVKRSSKFTPPAEVVLNDTTNRKVFVPGSKPRPQTQNVPGRRRKFGGQRG